jgi:hypothetical protein
LAFEAIEAASQFVHFVLARDAEVLEQVAELALNLGIPTGCDLGGILGVVGVFVGAELLEEVVYEGGGLGGVEASGLDPFVADFFDFFGYEGGGANAEHQKLTEQVVVIHGDRPWAGEELAEEGLKRLKKCRKIRGHCHG